MKVEDRVKVVNGDMAGAVGTIQSIEEGEEGQTFHVYISGLVNEQPIQGVFPFTADDLKAA